MSFPDGHVAFSKAKPWSCGTIAWFDAGSGVTTDPTTQRVTTWVDQNRVNTALPVTGGWLGPKVNKTGPNFRPSLIFDNINGSGSAGTSLSCTNWKSPAGAAPATVVGVYKSSQTWGQDVISWGPTSNDLRGLGCTSVMCAFSGPDSVSDTMSIDGFHIGIEIYNGSATQFYVDGSLKREPNATPIVTATATGIPLYLGKRSDSGPWNRFSGELAEAMVFDYCLTADARNSLESYLSQKYKISLKL